jgi:hypothetical protein
MVAYERFASSMVIDWHLHFIDSNIFCRPSSASTDVEKNGIEDHATIDSAGIKIILMTY